MKIFFFIQFLLVESQLLFNCPEQITVTLYIYSSKTNPQWQINSTQLNFFEEKFHFFKKQINEKDFTDQIMGYQGFSLSCSTNNEEIFIYENAFLEQILFETGKSYLSIDLINHIETFIGKSFTNYLLGKQIQPKTINCNYVPIKGPDTVPIYNPLTDNGGCFITKQSNNNCYAYATDIVTNTFPQPGRSSGRNPSGITCESIRLASIRDGLIYKGLAIPNDQPKLGHYLALFIWSNIDYHWIRKDANGYWSHKPGPGHVTNRDNRGLLISNPLKSNFTPWTKFCGFFIGQPSKVNIH